MTTKPVKSVLVVGAMPDWETVKKAAQSVDEFHSYTLEGASRLGAIPIDTTAVVDIARQNREMEEQAWEWTTGALAQVGSTLPLRSSDVLESMRRWTLTRLMLPIARARLQAEQLSTRIGAAEVTAAGLSASELIALREQYSAASVVDATRVAELVRFRVSMIGRFGSIARTLLLTLLDAARRPFHLYTLRDQVIAARSAGQEDKVALVVAALDQQMRFLESTLDELRSRGWRTVLALSLRNGSPSQEVVGSFDASIRITDLVNPRPFAALVRRRLQGRHLRRAVTEWTRAAGLDHYAEEIQSYLGDVYFLHVPGVLEAYEKLFRWIRPALVLTISETGVPELVVPVARRHGVPSVNVQHGVITQTKIRADFRFDAFCVFGEAYAENLAASGTDPARIRIVGNPIFDKDGDARGDSRGQWKVESREIDPSMVRILFAAQHSRDYATDLSLFRSLKPILEYLERDKSCQLLIKWHPYGQGSELGYELALAEHPSVRVHHVRDGNLLDLIESSDCVCAYTSTVVFDALSLRKPVIVISPVQAGVLRPMFSEVTDLLARNADEFGKCIERLRAGYDLDLDRWQKICARYACASDGGAGVRIADVCEELVVNRKT